MRKGTVHIALLATIAAIGCGKKEAAQRCTTKAADGKGATVVADSLCRPETPQQHAAHGHVHPIMPYYFWYYGGVGGYHPGAYISGGGYAPTPGVTYRSNTGFTTGRNGALSAPSSTRGGFGSTARAGSRAVS